MRAACVKRVQPEPAASQFSKHSLLTNYALGPACGGLRRPAVVSMRRYVRNTKSADAVVPMVLDKTNACQRSDCAESGSGTTLSSFALSRQELEKMDLKLCLFKVRFSSPTLELFTAPRPFAHPANHSTIVAELLCAQLQVAKYNIASQCS